ncbi:MAG: hypothetical protein WDO18_10570 [Acidobacteriota bacterium]
MSRKRIHLPIFPAILALAVLSSCGGSKSEETAKADTTKAAPQTATVSVIRPLVQQVSATVQATGSYVAQESSDVAPQSPRRHCPNAGRRGRLR